MSVHMSVIDGAIKLIASFNSICIDQGKCSRIEINFYISDTLKC